LKYPIRPSDINTSQSSIRPGDDSDPIRATAFVSFSTSRNPVFALEMIQTYRSAGDEKKSSRRNPVFALEMIQTLGTWFVGLDT